MARAPAPDDMRGRADNIEVRIRDAVAAALRASDSARLDEALAAIPPEHAQSGPAQALRAEILRRHGKSADAIPLYAEAILRCPELHAAYHCAALAHVAQRDLTGARALWHALLQRTPADPVARYQIALTWHDEGNFAEAARWYEKQLARDPDSFQTAYNLGLARMDGNDAAGAAAAFARATEVDPRKARAWMALGAAQRRNGEGAAAARSYLQAYELDPSTINSLAAAAAALGEAAELPAAIDVLDRAIASEPGNAALRFARASHLASLGLHAAALDSMREALSLDPENAAGHSALLLEMQYDTTASSRADLARAHWDWADRHLRDAQKVVRNPPTQRGGDSRRRIGYVSPRFGNGPLANLFLPVLEAHDRSQFHITLYSAHAHDDDIAYRMRAAADAWRDLPDDDDAAAAAIAADELDLLVDLAGHAPGHRLAVLARRPAPVQATWLDYFDTTGVPEIDYVLTDPVHTPAAESRYFRERIVWLPHCRFVYRPVVASALTAAPSRASGCVTFGSFNRHAKITDEVLAVWKSVLDAVPGSRLQLRASAYRGAGTVAWLRDRWAAAGLPVDRIDFRPFVPLAEAIAAYRDVDVALDTFPYNGGVTTCDALSMGVPVIALEGDRMIARQSSALLRAAGRAEWVAATPDEYVACAARVARSVAAGETREALFRAFPGTPLCRAPEFVVGLERAYRVMIEAGPRGGDALPPIAITA
jgi:predicted O-linked N-acetylglucosamine transferase (SPINDLY family)